MFLRLHFFPLLFLHPWLLLATCGQESKIFDGNANVTEVIDASSLEAKVLCGYQGWFRCPEDGTGRGWHHYGVQGKFEPGYAHIEVWPDVRELPQSERFASGFKHADGAVAQVFSSARLATTDLHFKWMREYGIDGVMLQRFVTETHDPRSRASLDQVLKHCQASAKKHGRGWALMYDLSGTKPPQADQLIEDWKHLVDSELIDIKSDRYFQYRSRPLIALWGIGFNDREPMLDQWERWLDFFQHDPKYGGLRVMLGVPYHWRTLKGDCIQDERLHAILQRADVISPWSVGRMATPQDATNRVDSVLVPDRIWCESKNIFYLPVVFPGFSWSNLMKSRGQVATFDQIPRRGGAFMEAQAEAAKQARAKSVYVAMFDELDEGTAIFKTVPLPSQGGSNFLQEPAVAPDHYLRLTGRIGAMLRQP